MFTSILLVLVVFHGLLLLGVAVWFVVQEWEVGMGKPTIYNICGFGQKAYISHELAARTKRRSMLNSRGNSCTTATSGWYRYR